MPILAVLNWWECMESAQCGDRATRAALLSSHWKVPQALGDDSEDRDCIALCTPVLIRVESALCLHSLPAPYLCSRLDHSYKCHVESLSPQAHESFVSVRKDKLLTQVEHIECNCRDFPRRSSVDAWEALWRQIHIYLPSVQLPACLVAM